MAGSDPVLEHGVSRMPEGVAPLEMALALLAHLEQEYRAVVTEVDVLDVRDASFTVRIPAASAGV